VPSARKGRLDCRFYFFKIHIASFAIDIDKVGPCAKAHACRYGSHKGVGRRDEAIKARDLGRLKGGIEPRRGRSKGDSPLGTERFCQVLFKFLNPWTTRDELLRKRVCHRFGISRRDLLPRVGKEGVTHSGKSPR